MHSNEWNTATCVSRNRRTVCSCPCGLRGVVATFGCARGCCCRVVSYPQTRSTGRAGCARVAFVRSVGTLCASLEWSALGRSPNMVVCTLGLSLFVPMRIRRAVTTCLQIRQGSDCQTTPHSPSRKGADDARQHNSGGAPTDPRGAQAILT